MQTLSDHDQYLLSVKITATPIGQSYQWDSLLDVDYGMLRHNAGCKQNVLDNPDKFPRADMGRVAHDLCDIHDFLALYPEG